MRRTSQLKGYCRSIWQTLCNQARNVRLLKSINLAFGMLTVVIVSTIIITSFIALLYLNVKEGFTNLALSSGLLAITTIVLAIVAFGAIWQNHSLQKRERKERLLNEIIEWAEDVARLNFKIYNFVEAQISKESWIESSIGEIVSQFQVVEAKGAYMNSIAISSFKEDKKLNKDIKAINKGIRKLVDVSVKRLDGEVTTEAVQKYMNILRLKITELFKEAAKIKTRDIS